VKEDAMKGSWLLAPLLVSALAMSEAVTPRRAPTESAVTAAIHDVDAALARRDASAALAAADQARRAALDTGRWQPLLEAGDAFARIAETTPIRDAAEDKARETYLAALGRARRDSSLDGVLRVADGLALLGDETLVGESLRAAEALATFDPEARDDVRAAAVRLADALERRLVERLTR
jgi:hypothetical protein